MKTKMAKFVIAGVCNCPRFALAEVTAEKLKAILPSFEVHKIMLDEGEPWEKWLQDVCVKNGWIHDQSPIVWRELLMRGSRGILIGNADEFLEYAKTYYGVVVNPTTLDLLRLALDNKRLHLEKHVRIEVEKESMQTLRIGVLAACHKVTLMILFQLLREGTLGDEKTLVLQLYCHPGHTQTLITIKNDLYDMASPFLREVIINDDFEAAVKGCSLIIWIEKPFICGQSTRSQEYVSETLSEVRELPRPRPNLQFDILSGTISRETRHKALAWSAATETSSAFLALTRSERPDSLSCMEQQPVTSSSESFVINQIEINELSLESIPDQHYHEQVTLEKKLAAVRARRRSSDVDLATPHKKSIGKSEESENDFRIKIQAELIGKCAEPDCRIIIAGDIPNLNLCAYVVAMMCPHLAPYIIAVSDVEIRARAALARKLGIRPSEVSDVLIWGNPGDCFTIDVSRAMVSSYDGAIWKREGFTRRLDSVFPFWKWFKRELKNELRVDSLSSQIDGPAMSLAHCVTTCLRHWYTEKQSELISVGVVSDGTYGIPKGHVITCPVYLYKGTWQSSSLDLPEEMLTKLNRLISRCVQAQDEYYQRLNEECEICYL